MSVEHIALVLNADGLDGTEKIVLISYANYTDAYGKCYPGIERVADDAGLSLATVKRTRKKLAGKNLLRTQRRANGIGDVATSVTRINLDKLAAMARARKVYDDDLLAGLEFNAEPTSEPGYPQGEQGSDLLIAQSEPTQGSDCAHPGLNLSSPRAQSEPQSVSDPSANPDPDAQARDERTDNTPENNNDQLAQEIVSELDLRKVDARGKQPEQIRQAVRRLLDTFPPGIVRRHVHRKLTEANTVRYLLTGLQPEHVATRGNDQAASGSDSPWCGACESPRYRFKEDARRNPVKCACHPTYQPELPAA